MNKPIKLPKKVIRDLDSYIHLVNLALDSGRGKFAHISAKSLHDMKVLYVLARYSQNVFNLKQVNSFYESWNRLDDFESPDSLDEFIMRKLYP